MTETIGRVASTDLTKRTIVLSDKDGILHPFKVPDALDFVLAKQKAGWYVKITSDGDLCKRIEYAPKPAGAPSTGRQYPPRNEKIISFLALHRDALQGAQTCTVPDTQDYDTFMDMVNERADRDLERAYAKYGGAP